MASTKELRTRIKSISNTAKVTGAMQMIAASKLRKAQNSAEDFNLFSNGYDEIKDSVLGSADFDLLSEISPLFTLNSNNIGDGKTLYILLSSNRGLAGPLFGNLVKLFESDTANISDKHFITVGKKIEKYVLSRNYNLIKNYEMKDDFNSNEIEELSNLVIDEFVTHNYSSVKLIYTHFKSVANQKAQIVDLLPFKDNMSDSDLQGNHIFEPNQLELILDFAPRFIFTIIYGAILDSLASEHAARMVAMQNATDNANELVDDLTLDLNKARQETITSELLDLVGGMTAIEEK